MTPQQLVDHLDKHGIQRKNFAENLGVSEAAISFWLKQGWITYERQSHIQLELRGKLRASWDDVPEERRPVSHKERAA